MSPLNDIPGVAELRAAAAKLGEALAVPDEQADRAVVLAEEAQALLPLYTDAQESVGWFADYSWCRGEHTTWRYLAEAARLRLLVESAALMQEDILAVASTWLRERICDHDTPV